MRYSRYSLVLINGIALLFSLYATDVINYIQFMISIIMSGLFVCTIMGRYWKRANWQGGIAALAGGAIASITVLQIESWNQYWGNPVIPSILLAMILGVLVSMLFPPSQVSETEALAILARERQEMEMTKEEKI